MQNGPIWSKTICASIELLVRQNECRLSLQIGRIEKLTSAFLGQHTLKLELLDIEPTSCEARI